jgi:hypothetical protein
MHFVELRAVEQLQEALDVFVGKTHEHDSLGAAIAARVRRRHGLRQPGAAVACLSPVFLFSRLSMVRGMTKVLAVMAFAG